MLTINTHCELFNVNRMQPDIKTAPGTFQQIMDTMLSGCNSFVLNEESFMNRIFMFKNDI